MPIPFIGRRFRPQEFKTYLDALTFTSFVPEFTTLHHTAAPSLAQRPTGFSDQHLKNLLSYYQDQLGWSGGPHLFVDDRDDGIIVFQRMDRRGVHAVSFNRNSWGLEMLGDYDSESFDSGRGAKVRDLSMQTLALLNQRLDVAATTIRFHRDDPKTSKTCPGTKVSKADVVARVAALMKQPAPAEMESNVGIVEWAVVLPGGKEITPVHVRDGRPIVRLRAFMDTVASGGTFALSSNQTVVTWTPKSGAAKKITIAELDSAGASWAFVRDLAEAAGKSIEVNGRVVTIGK